MILRNVDALSTAPNARIMNVKNTLFLHSAAVYLESFNGPSITFSIHQTRPLKKPRKGSPYLDKGTQCHAEKRCGQYTND